jgi:hypothetical protein
VPDCTLPLVAAPLLHVLFSEETIRKPNISLKQSIVFYQESLMGETIALFREHWQAELLPMATLDNRLVCYYLVRSERGHAGALQTAHCQGLGDAV